MAIEIISVSELSNRIKKTLEENFTQVSIIGEISNFKAHFSGHWYFTLKDSAAQISCTMWKGINNYVFFTPQDGMKVIVTGRITVYPPRGSYQIEVRSMKPAGEGELQAAFEKLKKKLADEGLFDVSHKKVIPKFPAKIGIVTAKDGAAFKDMISVAGRRYPLVELLIASTKVQGEGAAQEIAERIRELNRIKSIVLIIVGRGGGSLEDLWAFNEEVVARAVFESSVPIISGIGHEIDFTIADFVADLRAPTPTAAMELATPDMNEIFAFINDFSYTITDKLEELISEYREKTNQALSSYGFRIPLDTIKNRAQQLDNLLYRIDSKISNKVRIDKNHVQLLTKFLESFDVNKILRKGFALITQNSYFIKRAAELNLNEKINIKFFDKEVSVN